MLLTTDQSRALGGLIAQGFTADELLFELANTFKEIEDPKRALREFYDNWQELSEDFSVKNDDVLNWHVFLRQKLLQAALKDSTIPGIKLALMILDSLATIQSIGGGAVVSVELPTSITLHPKLQPEAEAESETK